jgi:hypothetical protein
MFHPQLALLAFRHCPPTRYSGHLQLFCVGRVATHLLRCYFLVELKFPCLSTLSP